MRINRELINIALKWIERRLFPDFSNKLTWLVVTTGCGILLTPEPLKLVILNWLVVTFNLNAGTPFTLLEIQSGPTDKILGSGIILLGLFHNIIYKYLSMRHSQLGHGNSEEIPKNDRPIVRKRVLEILTSDKEKLERLIPLLADQSHSKSIEKKHAINTPTVTLIDWLCHLRSSPISTIENEDEIKKIQNWLESREQINRQLTLKSRADYIKENEALLREELEELIEMY